MLSGWLRFAGDCGPVVGGFRIVDGFVGPPRRHRADARLQQVPVAKERCTASRVRVTSGMPAPVAVAAAIAVLTSAGLKSAVGWVIARQHGPLSCSVRGR
jgi:hypothetical protein